MMTRQDLRFAARALARSRMLAVAAVASIALGVGANTAMFSAVSAVLLRPIATPWLGRLVLVHDDPRLLGLHTEKMAPAEALDVAARRDLFDRSTAFTERTFNLSGGGETRRVSAALTLGDFYGVFGVAPAGGRFYLPADSRAGDPRQVVLSYAFWQTHWSGDPGVVGRVIQLDGTGYRVVGILPRAFRYPRGAQVFMPYPYGERDDLPPERGTLIMTAVSRLAPGVTLERARRGLEEEAVRWHRRFAADFKYDAVGHTLVALPLAQAIAGPLRAVSLVLLGAVGLVLLIACGNVATIQLVRTVARRKELAVRAALGASMRELLRSLLIESVILAGAGGVLGLALGFSLIRLIGRYAPAESLRELHLDVPVLLFTAATAVLVGVLVGIAPALRIARTDPAGALAEGSRGSSGGRERHRLLHWVTGVQIALTTVLLLSAGLLVRSLERLVAANPGFQTEHVVAASVSLPESGYEDGARISAFYTRALQALRELPATQAVGLTDALPLAGEGDSSPFIRADNPPEAGGAPPHANMHTVSEGYFGTLGIRLVRGRLFDPSDAESGPRVVVIDEQLARQFFAGEDPIGRVIEQGREATIVGVVTSANQAELGEPPKATTYYSFRQRNRIRTVSFVLKTALEPGAAVAAVRRALVDLDPGVAVYDVRTMPEVMKDSISPRRFTAAVLGGFSLLSLLLTALGIYGVLSYTTQQRSAEMGIRVALGAGFGDIVGLVLGTGARVALAGVVAGMAIFLALGRVVAALLYGVGPRDPATVLGGGLGLLLLALLASYLPARRAARLHPAAVLRAE